MSGPARARIHTLLALVLAGLVVGALVCDVDGPWPLIALLATAANAAGYVRHRRSVR